MAIRVKEINGKNYMYFIHYPDGKKSDVYCGAESKPESRRKVLKLEIAEVRRQISRLDARLAGLVVDLEKANKDCMMGKRRSTRRGRAKTK